MTFKIKNFGNDCECLTAADVAIALQRYRGKSVAIEDSRQGEAVYFVDVSPIGDVCESYGSGCRPFDAEWKLR